MRVRDVCPPRKENVSEKMCVRHGVCTQAGHVMDKKERGHQSAYILPDKQPPGGKLDVVF